MSAEFTAQETAALERALIARAGRERGDEIEFACPHPDEHKHGDTKPSASYSKVKRAWICRACGARGGFVSLRRLLGLGAGVPERAVERVWAVRTLNGEVIEHHRVDRPGRPKTVWWVRGGRKGLRGLRTADLRLYGAEDLANEAAGATVIVTEGEPAADALRARGFTAVGTVTGASGTPSDQSLDDLRRFNVVAWADHDDVGRDHMRRIVDRLRVLGVSARPFEWAEASRKGDDAADFFARGHTADELRGLLAGHASGSTVPQGGPMHEENGGEILDEVARFVQRFVVLSGAQADTAALWIAHTHAIDAAECTPYLHVTSAEKRSGKSRTLEVLDLLVARPWLTGRVTVAVLARKVHAVRPTLLLDESDAAFKSGDEYGEALRGVLNTGHRRGGCTSVVVGQGARMTFKDLETFGAKAIAGIGSLPTTIEDRSIRFELKRRAASERVERFRRRKVSSDAAPLRDRLARWATSHVATLGGAEPLMPDELDDRAADGWEPLLAIADAAGGEWPTRARRAAVTLSGGSVREDLSIGVRLLADCRRVFEGKDRLGTAELIEALAADDESPWGAWARGKRITPRGLGRLLRPYGIVSRNVRESSGVVKGYLREQFADAWSRYLSATPLQPAPDGHETVADERRENGPVADDRLTARPRQDGVVADVADAVPFEEQMLRAAAHLFGPAPYLE